MQRTAATHPAVEAERDRVQRAKYAKLTAHYGQIGSDALKAALLHARNKPAKKLERDEEKREAAFRPHPALSLWNRSRL